LSDTLWFSDESALTQLEQRPLSIAEADYGEGVTTTIDFVLPNMRLEEIHSGKLCFPAGLR